MLEYVALTKKRTLIITYNRWRKDETIAKAKIKKIQDYVEVHTFHSLLTMLTRTTIHNDDLFRDSLNNAVIPNYIDNLINIKLKKFESIVIDEAQDLSELYFQLVLKLVKNIKSANYMFIGDKYQCINSYKGANPNYFLEIDKIFPTLKWNQLDLSISFRLPHSIWKFFESTNLIYPKSGKSNDSNANGIFKIILEDTQPFSSPSSSLINEIIKDIELFGEEQVFILSPSHKAGHSFGNKIANELIARKFNVFKTSGGEEFTIEEISGK